MTRQFVTLTIAGILIVASLLTARSSDMSSRATEPVSLPLTASSSSGQSQPTTPSGTTGSAPADEVLIVWNDDASGDSHLWLVRMDGGEPRRLIADKGGLVYESWPQWSPDGSRIAFTGNGFDDMYLIDADGMNLVSLAARGA